MKQTALHLDLRFPRRAFPRVETPAFRRSDPVTSEIAAEAHTKSGKRQLRIKRVAGAVVQHPGLTSAELAPLCGFTRTETASRLPEARTARAIANVPLCEPDKKAYKRYCRKCRVNGSRAMTWWPT